MREGRVNLEPLQRAILEIYEIVRQICDRHGIRYYASGGTALGAMRHHGFIPWDDDLDLELPRRDYEKFRHIVKHDLPEGLEFISWQETYGYDNLFSKVMCTDAQYVRAVEAASGQKLTSGLFVDIFPSDGFPKSKIALAWRLFRRGVVMSRRYWLTGRLLRASSFKERFGALIGGFLWFVYPSLKTVRDCLRKEDEIAAACPEERAETMDISSWFQFDYAHFKGRHRITPQDFGKMTFVPFEGTTIPVPENVENYLKERYGEWRKLPPAEKRVPSHGDGESPIWRLGTPVVKREPLLSIVIANYNFGKYIGDAIESVLCQCRGVAKGCKGQPVLVLENGECVELIICDAGSKDESRQVIERYKDRLAWWCSEKDGGQSAAFNKGFAHSTGKFLTWLNSDDVLCRGCLLALTTKMLRHPDCQWFTGNFLRFTNEGKVLQVGWGPHWYPAVFQGRKSSVVVFGPTSFFSRAIYEKVGKIDESLHFAMDMDLWIRFIRAGVKQRRVRSLCWAFRLHADSKTSDFEGHRRSQELKDKSRLERKRIFEKTGYNLDKPHTLKYYALLLWRLVDGSLLWGRLLNLFYRRFDGRVPHEF